MDRDLEVATLSQEDLANWRNNPITMLILSKIAERIKETHLQIGGGVALDAERPENTAQSYAKMVGYIAGLRVILNIEVDEDTQSNA